MINVRLADGSLWQVKDEKATLDSVYRDIYMNYVIPCSGPLGAGVPQRKAKVFPRHIMAIEEQP